MELCENCLVAGRGWSVPIGYETGDQRDPIQDTLKLCLECKAALLEHDLGTFASRYSDTRTVKRGE